MPEVITSETLAVRRGMVEMEDPWTVPDGCTPVRLRRSTDAAPPRLSTSVAVWFDEQYLDVLFSAADDHVQASHLAMTRLCTRKTWWKSFSPRRRS